MNRISIRLSSLSKNNWTIIYRFINSIVNNKGAKLEVYEELKAIANIGFTDNPDEKHDLCELDDKKLSSEKMLLLSTETCFNIIYQKKDSSDDVTELVPFLLLQNELGERIVLGIEHSEGADKYYYRCGDFFALTPNKKPSCGENSFYFIFQNKETKELYTQRFSGKGDSTFKGNTSRRFLPILHITKNNYLNIFGQSNKENSSDNLEIDFINKSIDKIKSDTIFKFKKGDRNESKSIKKELNSIFTDSNSKFGQWLESGYFYSYSEEDDSPNKDGEQNKKRRKITNPLKNKRISEIQGIRNTLKIYKNSIFELIQNIQFHGGGNGLFYCVFERKINLPRSYQNHIPNFHKYNDDVRFLRIGIFDYNKKGIEETFRENRNKGEDEKVSLKNFFNPEDFVTTELSHLEMRYAARLGIKTFVNTLIKNKGFFLVESNNTTGKDKKKYLSTTCKDEKVVFEEEKEIDFTNGTHYEIILPVVPTEIQSSSDELPVQKESIFSDYIKYQPIMSFDIQKEDYEKIVSSISKEEQIEGIKVIGDSIIKQFLNKEDIAIKLPESVEDENMMANIIFKLAAYLQLRDEKGFNKIIITNIRDCFIDTFYELINTMLIRSNNPLIWSKDCALILLSQNLHTHIIWGDTKEEFYGLNQEMYKYFFNNIFSDTRNFPYPKEKYSIKPEYIKKYILPYDILVTNCNNVTPFEGFINQSLKREIITTPSEGIGYLVNHENTYIGNKIIVKNYYEADTIFLNNFFADRFAYLIAHKIQDIILGKGKELILIGYKYYSEFLLKSIYKSLKRIRTDLKEPKIHLVLANEEKDDMSSDKIVFNFKSVWQNSFEKRLLKNTEQFGVITIVPVSSTLSTHDKIISFFKLWFKQIQERSNIINNIILKDSNFLYNHSVIVVRDALEAEPTDLEKEFKWEEIDLKNKSIKTSFINAQEIDYTLQIARDEENNWVKRLNNKISFPKNWHEEEYVNPTENSSVNSQNLMGFPKVEKCDDYKHYEELDRLYSLKNFIYKGHVNAFNSHHKYYIHTENFIRNKYECITIKAWLTTLKNKKVKKEKLVFNHDLINVLITPNAEAECNFVNIVNESIFGGNALILNLDVKNWRNNIINKLSFLNTFLDKGKESINFHYVDQAMLSGETYSNAKSYLCSILNNWKKGDDVFSSIIALINRLPYAKNHEINNDVNKKFFYFLYLHYPSIQNSGQGCELCNLKDFYESLKRKTVLDNCIDVINKNVSRIEKKELKDLTVKDKVKRRDFIRLVLTHELYFILSGISNERNGNYDSTYKEMCKELDNIFDQFCNNDNCKTKSSINKKLNDWFKYDELKGLDEELKNYLNKKLMIDKKISFLKVISSPPLSKYIALRKYAQKKLLDVLDIEINNILKPSTSSQTYSFDDLRLIKSILKSLSFFKSNALVRREVIINSWKAAIKITNYFNEIIKKKKKRLYNFERLINGFMKGRLLCDELTKGKIKEIKYEIEFDIERIPNKPQIINVEDILIQDFSKDFQFFIKNAIDGDDAKATFLGELLRTGEEITNSSFNVIKINETKLALKDMGQNVGNSLFEEKIDSKTIFQKEYTKFLCWLFYDNTTILRKTLDHFYKEIKKDKDIYNLFYTNKDGKKEINIFNEEEILKAIELFKKKVKDEYYYSSFIPYIDNDDKIDYVEKLIYLTYAKIRLEDLMDNKHKSNIESDVYNLMVILAAIMGADQAFFTMKKDGRLFPISFYNKLNKNQKWDYVEWLLNDNYLTTQVLNDVIKYPFIQKFLLFDENKKSYKEKDTLDAKSMGIYCINYPQNNMGKEFPLRHHSNYNVSGSYRKSNIIAAFSFLYNENNPMNNSEKKFRINIQESGRLLLLLKNEINNYVVDYLINEKVLDLWIEKHNSFRKFDKIYARSHHTFYYVFNEMDEFEKIDDCTISQLSKTWVFLTNQTISFLYSNIEQNVNNENKHYLNIDKISMILDYSNTLGKTFNPKFISILSSLLSNYWNKDSKENQKNTILINNKALNQFNIDTLKNIKIICNRNLLRTFITQCLNNSLSTPPSGHRDSNDVKEVNIRITKSYIFIVDSVKNKIMSQKEISENVKNFSKKKTHIMDMRCDEYSSTTLTSLQGCVNYIKKYNKQFCCNFGINKSGSFRLIIKF